MSTLLRHVIVSSLCLGCATGAWAQWTSQSLSLRPGWNAVFLEVQPEPPECDALFQGLPVESAWFYNRRFSPVQFLTDTNQPITDPQDWLAYYPPGHPLAGQSSLFILEGGRPYLIKLATNAAPVNLTLRGPPCHRPIEWLADSLNFVGFHLPVNSPPSTNLPTVQSFFSHCTNLANRGVFRLDSQGRWFSNAPSILMPRGEAFWIRATGLPEYAGPLQLLLERRSGLDYGRVLPELTLRIRNAATNARTVILRPLNSEPPVSSAYPALAGSVPLASWSQQIDGPSKALRQLGWTNLASELVRSNLAPGEVWELRLEARRREMAPYTPPPGVSNVLYQSLLEVTDATGSSRLLVPVSAQGLREFGGTGGGSFRIAAAPVPEPSPWRGLWVGNATINQVSFPEGDPEATLPAASEFRFRLLVHVDAAGSASLLQKVLQMHQPGTYKPANDGSTNLVVDQPFRYLLFTDEALARGYPGAALLGNNSQARRFTSAAFGFNGPILMQKLGGEFGEIGAQFQCPVVLSYTNALNPFVHLNHPDHDNRTDRWTPLTVTTNLTGHPDTTESYTIIRQVTLEFTGQSPELRSLSGQGYRLLNGTYAEEIRGLHKRKLKIQGSFNLHRASWTAELNP